MTNVTSQTIEKMITEKKIFIQVLDGLWPG